MYKGVKWNKTGINLGKEIEVTDRTKGTCRRVGREIQIQA